MSKWTSRDKYAQSLTEDQLRDFYIKTDPRKRAPAPSRGKAKAYPAAVRGRGAYSTDEKKPRSKKGYVPNAPQSASFNPNYGARLGAVVGEGLQSFANAIGFGEYNIQQNSCMKMIDMGTSPPRVRNTNRGEAMIVNHREYLGELTTGTGTPTSFKLQQYQINPGNPKLFPFCANIADNFQEWEVRGMLVELKSEASNVATALSLGSMFAAVDYNTLDSAPANKIELENLEYACSNKPTDSIIMPVECARKNDVMTHLYIAEDSNYQGGDKRLYDLGTLFVGSFGCPTAEVPIAEIWVTYEIALYKPHLHKNPVPNIGHSYSHYYGFIDDNIYPLLNGQPVAGSSGTSFCNGVDEIQISNLGTEIVTKRYLITCWWRTQGTITAPAPPGLSTGGALTIVANQFSGIGANFNQTYAYTPASTLIAADSFSMQFIVQVVGDYSTVGYVKFDGAGSLISAGKTSWWDVTISEMV
jgi:hypothetical protein